MCKPNHYRANVEHVAESVESIAQVELNRKIGFIGPSRIVLLLDLIHSIEFV